MRFWAVIKYYVDLYHIATIFVLAFSLFGIANLLLKKKFTILFCLLISYILFGPFFIFYNSSGPIIYPYTTGVIERFYIFSLIFIMIFFSLACSLVLDSMEKILKSKRISKNRINIYKFILYLVFLIIPFYLLIINFKTTDLSNVSIGEEMGKDYLINLPKDSFLFISGDTATQNIWYVQHILGFRKDVTVINPQLPYLNMRFVKKIYPKFINPKKPFLDLKFKINKVILDNYGKRFAFAGYGAVSLKEKEIEWIPRGLSQKMIIGPFDQDEADFIKQTEKIWNSIGFKKYSELSEAEKASQILISVQSIYSQAAFNTGVFIINKYGNLDEAKKYFEISYLASPSDNLGKVGLATYYYFKDECKKSEEITKELLIEESQTKNAYIFLFNIYKECFKDFKKSKQIEKIYKEKFNEKIQ